MIRETGIKPQVIEYLKTPPTRQELLDLLHRMGMTPRQLLRRRGTPYDELGLGNSAKPDECVCSTPSWRIRSCSSVPSVVGPRGVRLCRPPERLREVMPAR